MRWASAVWLLLVTAGSLAPLKVKVQLHTVGSWHNIFHFFAFCLGGLLFLVPAASSRAVVLRAVALALFCAVIEYLEAVVYHNKFEWRDFYLDCFSLSVAWLLSFPVRRLVARAHPAGLRPYG